MSGIALAITRLSALRRYQLDAEARQLERDLTRLEGALRRRREAGL
jgi:hypothetical protein